jgi:hypothetical protein
MMAPSQSDVLVVKLVVVAAIVAGAVGYEL